MPTDLLLAAAGGAQTCGRAFPANWQAAQTVKIVLALTEASSRTFKPPAAATITRPPGRMNNTIKGSGSIDAPRRGLLYRPRA
jgi:hypothetical protein